MPTNINGPDDVQIFVEAVLDAYKRGSTTRQSAATILLLLIEEHRSDTPRQLSALARDLTKALSENSHPGEGGGQADTLGHDFMVMRIATGQDNTKDPRPQRE